MRQSSSIEYMSTLEGFAKGRLVLSSEPLAIAALLSQQQQTTSAAAAAATSPQLTALSCDSAVIDGIVLAIHDHISTTTTAAAAAGTSSSSAASAAQRHPFVQATFNVLTNLLTSTSLPINARLSSVATSNDNTTARATTAVSAQGATSTPGLSTGGMTMDALLGITLEMGNNYRIWCLLDALLKTPPATTTTASSAEAVLELQNLILQNLPKLVTTHMPFAALNPLLNPRQLSAAAAAAAAAGATTKRHHQQQPQHSHGQQAMLLLSDDCRCVFVTLTQLYFNILNSWLVTQRRATITMPPSSSIHNNNNNNNNRDSSSVLQFQRQQRQPQFQQLLPPDTRNALEGHIHFLLDSVRKQHEQQQQQQQQGGGGGGTTAGGGGGGMMKQHQHQIDHIRNTTQQLLSSFQRPAGQDNNNNSNGATTSTAMDSGGSGNSSEMLQSLSGQRLVTRFVEQIFSEQRMQYACEHCAAYFGSEAARDLHNRIHFYYRAEPVTRCFGATLQDFVNHDHAAANAAANRIIDEHIKQQQLQLHGPTATTTATGAGADTRADQQQQQQQVPSVLTPQLLEKLDEQGVLNRTTGTATAAGGGGVMYVPLFVPTSKVTQKPDLCYLSLRTQKKGKRTERE